MCVRDSELDLKALCDRGRVTPRTVHFYVQQGLLPPASAPGPGARYGEGHIARLRLIRLLKKQHLPLAEIGKRLKGLSDSQAEALITEARQRRERTAGTALDYIRGILADTGPQPPTATRPSSVASSTTGDTRVLHTTADSRAPGRSQWDRFALADGIELHVQRPLAREQQRRLDKLLLASREIFEEEPI